MLYIFHYTIKALKKQVEKNFKKSLEHCNENIASLQSINEDSDMEITNFVYFLYSSELIFKLSL